MSDLKKSKSKKVKGFSSQTVSSTAVRKVELLPAKGLYIHESSKLAIDKETKETREKQRGTLFIIFEIYSYIFHLIYSRDI